MVSVPVLSKTAVSTLAERFECATVPHDDLSPRRAADAGDDRDRRRENQRTRRRDDEYGEHTRRVACREVCYEANEQRCRCEPDRITIGKANERRLGRLRRAHQLDDLRVLTVFGARDRGNGEDTIAVDTSAHQRCAGTRRSPGRARRSVGPRRRANGRRLTMPSHGTSSPGRTSNASPTLMAATGRSSTIVRPSPA